MISLIMATYNSEKYITYFFESFRAQERENIELIVIDSCSKDKTIDIINQNKDIVSHLLIESDNSVYEAWNKGLKLATGKWICFIGSDDILETGCLKTLKKSVQDVSHENNLIIFNSIFIDINNKAIRKFQSSFNVNDFKNRFTFSHPMCLHKSELFTNQNFSCKHGSSGDYFFLLSNLNRLNPVVRKEYIVRLRQDGISQGSQSVVSSYLVRKELKSIGFVKNIYNFFRALLAWKYHRIIQK